MLINRCSVLRTSFLASQEKVQFCARRDWAELCRATVSAFLSLFFEIVQVAEIKLCFLQLEERILITSRSVILFTPCDYILILNLFQVQLFFFKLISYGVEKTVKHFNLKALSCSAHENLNTLMRKGCLLFTSLNLTKSKSLAQILLRIKNEIFVWLAGHVTKSVFCP